MPCVAGMPVGKEKSVQRVGRRELGASFLLLEGTCRSSDFHPCWSQSNRNISVLLAPKSGRSSLVAFAPKMGRECCQKTLL